MRVYIAGVSSEKQYVKTLESFLNMRREEGDRLAYLFGRPGFIARMDLVDDFMKQPEYDAVLLVDMDMVLPEDGLERLRSHDLDIVTGHYFRRDTNPLMSICQHVVDGWQLPLIDVPESGLHKITGSGFGFVLIKREVMEAVAALPKIIHPIAPGPVPEQGHYDLHGQDIRFFFYTLKLGYQLWLDADVECKHATTMYTSRYLYNILRPHQEKEWEQEMKRLAWAQKRITQNESENWKNYLAP